MLVVVVLYALAHHIGSLNRGAIVDFTGRCLYEIGAGIHRQHRCFLDIFSCTQRPCLEYRFKPCFAGTLLYFRYLVGNFLVAAIGKQAQREHYVDLVCSVRHCKCRFGGFHLKTGLRRWKIGRTHRYIYLAHLEH